MEYMDLIRIFWFFLPAGMANMAPVLFRWINFLNYPIDFNKQLNKKPIFGKNKTFRGLFFGIVLAILVVYIQKILYAHTVNISLIDYSVLNPLLLGFLLGFGALFGDSIKSFFKRRLNINPGKSWIPLDQIDWIIGSIIFVIFYVKLSLMQVLVSIVLFGLLHPVINLIGYLIKIKKNKF